MPPGFRFPGDIDVCQRLAWDLKQHSRAPHFMEGATTAIAQTDPSVSVSLKEHERTLRRALGYSVNASSPHQLLSSVHSCQRVFSVEPDNDTLDLHPDGRRTRRFAVLAAAAENDRPTQK